jgi:hypothetical protein
MTLTVQCESISFVLKEILEVLMQSPRLAELVQWDDGDARQTFTSVLGFCESVFDVLCNKIDHLMGSPWSDQKAGHEGPSKMTPTGKVKIGWNDDEIQSMAQHSQHIALGLTPLLQCLHL